MRSAALGPLLAALLLDRRDGAADRAVTLVTNDSRRVIPGAVFCAIRGARADGGQFVAAALAAGAQAVVGTAPVPSEWPAEVAYYQVGDDYQAYAWLVQAFYDYPDRAMRLTAVTGTNGKTTSVLALHHCAAAPAGLLSTIRIDTGSRVSEAEHTTPEAGELFRLLAEMRANGCREVFFEASSHALAQHRLGQIKAAAAIFTNLTGDHLDYHGDAEHYYQAKKRLFTAALAPGAPALIHLDAPGGARLAAELTALGVAVHTFGAAADARHRVETLAVDLDGSRFRVDGVEYSTNLVGDYNVANLAGVVLARRLTGAAVPERFELTTPGRLERLDGADGVTFFVDFAHTDDALRQVLTTLRRLTAGRLIVVFGAGGERDRGKRPRMGRVAAELADVLILTSDNPRSEEPEAILREIAAGIPAGVRYELEPERERGIRRAAELAQPGDVVLVAGKGHETTQEIAGRRHPFDDRAVIRRIGHERKTERNER